MKRKNRIKYKKEVERRYARTHEEKTAGRIKKGKKQIKDRRKKKEDKQERESL